MLLRKSLVSGLTLALAAASTALAATIYVPDDYTSIQDALDAAVGGDEVVLREGVYHESGIAFHGSAAGGGVISLRGENPEDFYSVSNTIINAGYNNYVMRVYSGGPGASISGISMIHGSASGLIIRSGEVTIDHCIIRGNSGHDGGGIYCKFSEPTLRSCFIQNNHADHGGGGLYFEGTSATMIGCDVRNNSATTRGGAMDIGQNSFIDASSCLFFQNGSNGAVVRMDTYTGLTFGNCTMTDNWGAGLVSNSDYATFDVSDSIIWGNNPYNITWINASCSDIQGYGSGFGNIDENPHFVSWNGIFPVGLRRSSPCIDAGCFSSDVIDWGNWINQAYGEVKTSAGDMGAYGGSDADAFTWEWYW